jgi:hypothetical protein
MTDVIHNPRRVPRAPARCEARCLLPGGGFWATDTADIGPRGCQLTAPGQFKVGDPVKLALTNERVGASLTATGRVAWSSPRPPWRIGVVFTDEFAGLAATWFDQLVAAYPGLATFQLAPDTIAVTDTIYPGAAPRVNPDLVPEEVAVLRAVGSGATVAALRERLAADWPAVEGLLFAMVGKKHLALDATHAGQADAWKPYLHGP